MTPTNPLTRLSEGETLHTEFKQQLPNMDDLASGMIAFANTDGGQLFVGVADDGQVVGVANPDRVCQQIDQVAVNNCEPPITIVQEVITDEAGRKIVVVNIPKGDQRPYRTNRGRYYVRTSSGKRIASRGELLRLFQATESLYYDETSIFRATFNDLSREAFDQFLLEAYGRILEEWGITFEALLRNLNAARADHPTLAGLLFFGRQPQRFLPQAMVTAARIPGLDLSVAPLDQKRLDGRLTTMLDEAGRFLRLHLRSSHVIQGFEPETYPELPEDALREAVINALAHRDYTIQGPIRLFIFDDRVEIRSPGQLPNSVTIEAMRLGAAHVLRNPTIYALLNRYRLVTDIGSGIFRMSQRVRQATGQEIGLRQEGVDFVVDLPRTPSDII